MSNQQQQHQQQQHQLIEKVSEEIKEIRNELLRQSMQIKKFEDFLLSDVKELRRKLNESNDFYELEILKLSRNLTSNFEFLEDKFNGRIGNIISEICRIIDDEITPLSEKMEKISNLNVYERDVVG